MARIVKRTEEEFWDALSAFCAPRSTFDAQGDAHGDIDLRLVEGIDAVIAPTLGSWEKSEDWWHQLDFYGDGIRSLVFSARSFSPEFIPSLQRLLAGEHEQFCILCQVVQSPMGPDEGRIGSIAIRAHDTLVSYALVEYLNGQV
jgi:hypothetical protein